MVDWVIRVAHAFSGFAKKAGSKINGYSITKGIVFLKNKSQFKSLITMKHIKKRGNNKDGRLGYPLESLSIIPTTDMGTQLLRYIMYTQNAKGVSDKFIQQNYSSMKPIRSRFYDFKDENDVLYYNGVLMDAIKLRELYVEISEASDERKDNDAANVNEKIGIVCFEWQKEFYDVLFQNIKINYKTI